MSAYKIMLLSLHHRKEWIFSLISSFTMALRWWPHPELLVFTCMSPTFTSQPHPHLSSTRSNIAAVLYNASCAAKTLLLSQSLKSTVACVLNLLLSYQSLNVENALHRFIRWRSVTARAILNNRLQVHVCVHFLLELSIIVFTVHVLYLRVESNKKTNKSRFLHYFQQRHNETRSSSNLLLTGSLK